MTQDFQKYLPFLIFLVLPLFDLFAQEQNPVLDSYFNKLYTHMYTNQDSTQFYKNKIIKEAIVNKKYEYLFYAYFISNKSAAIFNNLEELESNLKTLDSLLQPNTEAFKNNEFIESYEISYLYDKAIYFYKLNNYNETLTSLKHLLKISNKTPDSLLSNNDKDMVYGTYGFLTKIHINNQEFELASEYLDKNIRLVNAMNDTNKDVKLYSLFKQKGQVLKALKDYKQSNIYLKKAFNFNIKANTNSNDIINEANAIAENYLALKNYDSASYYIGQIKPYADTNLPYGFLYYKTNAKLSEAIGKKEEVVKNYKKALQLLHIKWKDLKQVEIAETLQSYSNFFMKNDKYNEALKQNTSAINQVKGKDVINSSINQITLFKLLQQKAKIELKLKQFDKAIKTTKQATALLDTLKPSFKSKADKLLLIENAYNLFENALEATYNNYHQNKNSNLSVAFFFLEKSKSTLLLEALLSTKAEKFSKIPNDILLKEQIYKTKITELEKQLNNQATDALKDQLFSTKTNYRKFLDTLETTYKDYYNLKYNPDVLSLNQIQKKLKSNTAMLSFFYGNNVIYEIILDKNKTYFRKIELTETLENQIKLFQRQISNPNSDITELKENAANLYSTIVAPLLNQINQPNLIVLTDGLLNYIPFETLIKDNHFLVEDYAISYINSMTLLNEINQKNGIKNSLLAFAPSFDGNITSSNLRSSLQALPHNKTEIQNINQYYKGDLFFNENATLTNFKNNAKNYGILHLATHAIYNDSNPEFSYLAFGNDAKDLLYVSDLYNLNLNANLVTLSACESGIGDLKRGEGLLSLARGFYFSGTKSIASTLWKINDASSAQLMSDFYKNLAQEQTKQIALQQAKIDFLKENKDNALSHPYYWSAFVLSGNTDALTNTNYWLWIGLGLAGFALIGLFFKKKKLNSNR